MCLSPVSIKNKSALYRPGIDKLSFTVPCNHCAECVSRNRSDMFVRMAYEHNRYTSAPINGSVMFVTFTWNEFSIPKIDTSSVEFEPLRRYVGSESLNFPRIKCLCFDKDKIRGLFKQLNNWAMLPDWLQCLIPKYNRSIPIKHFVVCELGDEYFRPHVHVLFFLPFKIDALSFRRVLEFCFAERRNKKTVDKDVLFYLEHSKTAQRALKEGRFVRYERGKLGDYLIYMRRNNYHKTPVYMYIPGFVKYSKEHPPVIVDINGMQYLLKYLYKHKDEHYNTTKPNIMWLVDFVKKLDGVDTYNDVCKPLVKQLKNSVPFSLISNEFGTSLLDEFDISSEEGKNNFIDVYINGLKEINVPNQTRSYAVPKYIIRRLFYQNQHYVNYYTGKNQSITYLSEFGVKAVNLKMQKVHQQLVKRYTQFFSSAFLVCANEYFVTQFEQRYKVSFRKMYMELKLFNRPEFIADYLLYYRDVNIPKKFEYLFSTLDSRHFEDYKKFALNIKGHEFDIQSFFDTDGHVLYGVSPGNPYFYPCTSLRFNEADIIKDYRLEDVIVFVDTCDNLLKELLSKHYVKDEIVKKTIKRFYQNLYLSY